MKLTITNVVFTLAIALCVVTTSSAQTSNPVPSAEEVVSKMIQFDAQRQSEQTGYTATRRYAAVNKKRHAEMLCQRVAPLGDSGHDASISKRQAAPK